MDKRIRYAITVFFLLALLPATPALPLAQSSTTPGKSFFPEVGAVKQPDLPRSGRTASDLKKTSAAPGKEKAEGQTLTNTLGQTFVRVEPGSFMMGSSFSESNMDEEVRRRRVTLTQGFYVQTTEVTQGQWKAVMGTSPWSGKSYVREGDDYPATCVSWHDAQEFITRLNQKEGAEKYRLPTEAQWEYACRAGSTTAYSFGESASRLEEYGWYRKNTWDRGEGYAHRAGQKRPNNWGIYDMHGNVWEWCAGWYEDYPSISAVDPVGPLHGTVRVYRGGSWNTSPGFCRSFDLVRSKPDFRFHALGFRLIRAQ